MPSRPPWPRPRKPSMVSEPEPPATSSSLPSARRAIASTVSGPSPPMVVRQRGRRSPCRSGPPRRHLRRFCRRRISPVAGPPAGRAGISDRSAGRRSGPRRNGCPTPSKTRAVGTGELQDFLSAHRSPPDPEAEELSGVRREAGPISLTLGEKNQGTGDWAPAFAGVTIGASARLHQFSPLRKRNQPTQSPMIWSILASGGVAADRFEAGRRGPCALPARILPPLK